MREADKKAFEPLDEYEKDLIEALEKSDTVLEKPDEERLKTLQESAKETLRLLDTKKQISIKLKEKDLLIIKQKAREISIPYQNIIQALVHNYAVGKIKLEI